MMRYWGYLKYVLWHKWYVLLECWRLGYPWLGLIHDWSKLLPSEFIPYARHFFRPDGSPIKVRGKTGYYKPTDTGDAAFDYAWFLHQKRNRHHWQYWLMPQEGGGTKPLRMPARYQYEMLADWCGAAQAQGKTRISVQEWYAVNRDKMQFEEVTRAWIEDDVAALEEK